MISQMLQAFQAPGHVSLEGGLSLRAVGLSADRTGQGWATGIGVYEQFYLSGIVFLYQSFQLFDLVVALFYCKIPGHGEVAIYMNGRAIADGAEIVNVHPIVAAVLPHDVHQMADDFRFSFVHDAGDGSSQQLQAGIKNDQAENNGGEIVEPGSAGEIQQQHAD